MDIGSQRIMAVMKKKLQEIPQQHVYIAKVLFQDPSFNKKRNSFNLSNYAWGLCLIYQSGKTVQS